MTENQKRLRELLDRQSQERGRMAELSRAESLDVETRAELDRIEAGTPDLERQIRAARMAVESDDASAARNHPEDADPETRERIELRNRCTVGAFLGAALRGGMVQGAEAEYAQAVGVASGIPIDLWELDRPAPETRADTVTAAPSTVGVNLQPIQPYLFARAVVPRLGVSMPSAATGTYASPTITGNNTPAARRKGEAISSNDATITVTSATPKRISARLSLRLEDIAAVGQANFEAALRENMAMALSAELDNQGLNGNGTAPNLSGLLAGVTDYANTAPSAVATFSGWHGLFAELIDGNWAEMASHIHAAVGVETYRQLMGLFAANDDSVNALHSLKGQLGGLWTSERMPDAASNLQDAIAVRMGHSTTKAVCPHWGRVEIDDIYTDSAKGIRHFTAHVLLGDVILVQPSAYAKLRIYVA